MKDTNIRDFLSRPIIELIPPLFLNNNNEKKNNQKNAGS